MSITSEKFELLDKAEYHYVDYNKPYEFGTFEDFGFAASGNCAIIPNAVHEGIIIKIIQEEINSLWFEEDGNFEKYTSNQTYYILSGLDKKLTASQLKKK